jgi:hypothetical protein
MGYHAVKNIGLGKFFVEMGWIDVSRNDGEQLDILVRQRAHETGRVANFQFVEGSICHRVHDISFALSQNVIAAIDIFDIAGESLCSVANEECGKADAPACAGGYAPKARRSDRYLRRPAF